MKRWYDTQVGAPFAHAPVDVTRISISASFAGTSAIKLSPYSRIPATAQFNTQSNLAAALSLFGTRLQAVATFTANSGLSADFRRFVLITAAFAAGSNISIAAPYRQIPAAATLSSSSTFSAQLSRIYAAVANFAGNSALSATNISIWRRWSASANFVGATAVQAAMTQRGILQATANFSANSNASISNVRQKMQAVASFAGGGQFSFSNARMRMPAIARFASGGSLAGDTFTLGAIPPNAPVLTLNSTADDTTPDFFVDLPTGVGNQTDVQVGDVLVIEYDIG